MASGNAAFEKETVECRKSGFLLLNSIEKVEMTVTKKVLCIFTTDKNDSTFQIK